MSSEVLAVNAVSDAIAGCPRLGPVVGQNDKTIFTDGHIEIFSSTVQSKDSWIGRVQVQVKGRSRTSKRPVSKFSVERSALMAFQNTGGVIYFLVSINAKTHKRLISYAILSPFTVQAYLAQEDSSKISVKLKPLPEDADSIERIVHLASEKQKERVEEGFDHVLFQNMESLTLLSAEDQDLQCLSN